jgi:hypothetical protein
MRPPKHIAPVPSSSDSEGTDHSLTFGTRRSKVRLQEATILSRRASRTVLVARLPSLSSAGSRGKGWGEVSKPRLSAPREIKLTCILVDGKHIEGVQKVNLFTHLVLSLALLSTFSLAFHCLQFSLEFVAQERSSEAAIGTSPT